MTALPTSLPAAPVSRRTALGSLLGAVAAIGTAAATTRQAEAALPAQGYRALALARTFVGRVPYRYGGTTPAGFDCSGLTQYVYRSAGMSLPRTAQSQRAATRRVSSVSAQPGDLVFFHSGRAVYHVGIYAGAGKMVDAGSSRSGIKYRSIWSTAVSYGTLR